MFHDRRIAELQQAKPKKDAIANTENRDQAGVARSRRMLVASFRRRSFGI
jgi:hypothetical protein